MCLLANGVDWMESDTARGVLPLASLPLADGSDDAAIHHHFEYRTSSLCLYSHFCHSVCITGVVVPGCLIN